MKDGHGVISDAAARRAVCRLVADALVVADGGNGALTDRRGGQGKAMSIARAGQPTTPARVGIGAPSSPVAASPSTERRPELDFMRAFVVAGLVVFHSAIVFTTVGSWFVNDPRPSEGFDVFVLWGLMWGMPLLFVVSGMAVHHALRTRSAGAFLRERLLRLLAPFVVGLVALVPPMFYLERVGSPGFHESYGHFWLRFLDVPALTGGVLSRGVWRSGGDEFDPAHLWFLYVLLLLSMALLPLFQYLRRPAGMRLIGRMADAAERHPFTLLLAGAVPMGLVEAIFGPDKVTGGWERLAYLFPLLFGFVIASNRQFEGVLRRERRPAFLCAVVSTALLVVWAAGLAGSDDIFDGGVPGWGALQGVAGWAWIVAILGFAGSWTTRSRGHTAIELTRTAGRPNSRLSGAARYPNEAVLPFYVLHEPVIVGAAWIIVRWQAPIPAKYLALVVVSFAGTLALYDLLVRRWRVTRFLFGMKARPPVAVPRSLET
jgi:peptidoglycan/LPS O-acetylase OafA/YrhL